MATFDIKKAVSQDNLHTLTTTIFVAIDGHGGSGKTTFASRLSILLNAEVVHVDDFASYLESDEDSISESIVKTIFEPIKKGATSLIYTPKKFWEDHKPEPTVVTQVVTPVMILEGVGSNRKQFQPYIGFSIFVNTPIEVCLERGITRDSAGTGTSKNELTIIWKRWLEKEVIHFEKNQNKERSDLLVDGQKTFESQIKTS